MPGTLYAFRVRAANIHGFGQFSDPISIKAAGLPDQVLTVTTSIDAATGGVVIDWLAPHDGSQTITEYLVEIANADGGSYFEEDTNCSGSDPSVHQCVIPMSALTQSPFNLSFDQLVVVRVTAVNSYGPSTPSLVNTQGARIRQVPI